jgi:hypothetical protein
VSTLYTPMVIGWLGTRASIRLGMFVLGGCMILVPHSVFLSGAMGILLHSAAKYLLDIALAVAALLFFFMGSARGMGGTALNTSLMELVPKHFMGRVQNTFYFMGTLLQLVLAYAVAFAAHHIGLSTAYVLIAIVYLGACASTLLSAEPASIGMDIREETTVV